jgi:hypothetical protein
VSTDGSLALLRIEHKLDLILASLAARDPALHALLAEATGLDDYNGDLCPTCQMKIKVRSDLTTEEYVRTCGCKPEILIIPGISTLNIPIVEKKPPVHPNDPEEPDNAEVPSPSTRQG